MSLNKVQPGSNMFQWITHTWNPIKGDQTSEKFICFHDCVYCYMKRSRAKRFYQGRIILDEKALKDSLKGKGIFVCDCTDLFAVTVPMEAIEAVVKTVLEKEPAMALFLTKNPCRYHGWIDDMYRMKHRVILGTTVETDYHKFDISRAPNPMSRISYIYGIKKLFLIPTMISIEPVMAFSPLFAQAIITANPDFVAIGANTTRSVKLPGPSPAEVRQLILDIRAAGIKVIVKSNLERLIGHEMYLEVKQ